MCEVIKPYHSTVDGRVDGGMDGGSYITNSEIHCHNIFGKLKYPI